MIDKKVLTDEELESVTGGANTGDINDNKEVYLELVVKIGLVKKDYSGWYGPADIEAFALEAGSYKTIIEKNLTPKIVNAIQKCYEVNNATMSQTVKNLLGL